MKVELREEVFGDRRSFLKEHERVWNIGSSCQHIRCAVQLRRVWLRDNLDLCLDGSEWVMMHEGRHKG